MKKLALTDIRGPRLYEGFRDDLRKRVIEVKRRRRFGIGPMVTVVFENRTTVMFQIEEMCRAEHILDPAKIQAEVDVYNELLPDEGELGATLFVELTDQATLESSLNDLVGLQDHVWLDVGDVRMQATFDAEQFATDKLAAVQYLRFRLGDAGKVPLQTAGTPLRLRIEHPRYRHAIDLGEAARTELAADVA